jgi:hypothetical protein
VVLSVASSFSVDVPAWISSAGIAALVSGVFLVVGTWINGSSQRRHEDVLNRRQFEHERRIERDRDARTIRDRKYERLRPGLRFINQAARSVQLNSVSPSEAHAADVRNLQRKWPDSIMRQDLLLDWPTTEMVTQLEDLLEEVAAGVTLGVEGRSEVIINQVRTMLAELEQPIG